MPFAPNYPIGATTRESIPAGSKAPDFLVTADQNAVLVTTYMPEAEFDFTYYQRVPLDSKRRMLKSEALYKEPDRSLL